MSIFKRLKDKTKNLLFGSNKIGDFVDNTTQNFKKLRSTVHEATKSEPRTIKLGGKDVSIESSFADPGNFILSSGAVGKSVGRVLKKAAEKGVGNEGFKKILSIPEKTLQPLSKIKDKANILKEPSQRLTEFLKSEGKYLQEEAGKRTEAISSFTNTNPAEIVKIRRAGNGTIKITKGELETMKKAGDLKPVILQRKLQNPIRVFEELGEPIKELFYRPVKAAEGVLFKAKSHWSNEFSNATKGLNTKSSNKIMINALALEEDGIKLLGKKKVPLLNDKEKAAWDFMKQRYVSLLDGVNNARAIVGKEPIKPRANYITHIRDLGILDNMGFSAVTDDIETLLSNKVHRNSPAFKFAKRRTDSLADIEMDAFNVFNKYQEKALENIYMTPAIAKIRELSRTVIDDGADKFKLQEVSPRLFKYVNEWTDYVVGQKIDNYLPEVIESGLKSLNKNVAVSTLAFNIQSAVIQPAAIINTVTEINPKNTAIGIKSLLSGKGKFAVENSNVLLGRQFDTAVKDIANSTFGKFSRLKSSVGKTGTKLLQVLDGLTAQATWLGAYNKAVNVLKLEGKQAFNYADDIVVKTQASASASDIAPIQRSTEGRLLTQFQTFVINDFNRLGRDVLGIGNEKMSKSDVIKKTATWLIGVSMWNHLSEDVLGIPSPFPRPIKELKESGPKSAAIELTTQLPIVGGAARYGSGIVFGSVGDLIQSTTNKVSGKYTPTSWWEIVGKVVGVPGTVQLKKTLKSIKGLSDGYSVTYQKTLANGDTVNKKAKIKITDSVDKIRALLFGMYNTMGAKEVRENKGKKSTNKPKLVMPPK